jgi:NADH dehydrogenase (ubiquinone) 1 alpha/beta subcomplex 1
LKDVEDRILDVLKKFDKVDPSKVHVDAHLVNDLGLDSLDVVEVVMAFEDEFSIEVNDTDAENVLTVQDAIKLVSKQLGVQAA